LSWDSNTSTTVGNAPAELVNVSSLVEACQTLAVALAVDFNVFQMTFLELLHRGLDVLHAALFAHGLG